MDGFHLSLSDRHTAFVDSKVASGGFPDASAYLTALIDATERAEARAKLEALLLEGLEGPFTPWTEVDAEALRQLAKHGR